MSTLVCNSELEEGSSVPEDGAPDEKPTGREDLLSDVVRSLRAAVLALEGLAEESRLAAQRARERLTDLELECEAPENYRSGDSRRS
jgi:hypothetical protein